MSFDLLADALISGVLLGGFYAAVSIGLAVVFGMLDVPQVAHPALLVAGGYGTFWLAQYGIDPLLAGLLLAPPFFLAGMAVYRFYHATFERRGTDAGLRGLAFFFGLAFVLEVGLILAFGVDQRLVQAPYIGTSLAIGEHRMPLRMLVAFGGAVLLTGGFALYLGTTYSGRAIKAVAQDETALQLMGADPVRIKQLAFGIATSTAAISGALLIIVGPIEPGLGRLYLGKVFSIVVLAGLGSIPGTFVAALVLGVSESLVLSSLGVSWAPAVSFGLLLAMLAIRPAGLFGRT